ncbi:MAG: thioredoxin family protein [Chloroflexi bacterium]|nr:thioredoxin family protein [Chloroflexota bacterium]
MAVTRERFESGMTYDEYKAQMNRNKEQFEANEHGVVVDPGDLAAFTGLPRPLNVLVLGEDWCGDVIANFPVIGRLAPDSGKLNLRCFLRDQHPDIMDQYLKDGRFRSIPVFVFFDDDMHEIGRFVERPDCVTALRDEKRKALSAEHPEFGLPDTPIAELPEDVRVKYQAAMAEIRAEMVAFANKAVIEELRAIVERGA